ncbi:anoctamin-5 isoform X4 [Condylostylus longicornis]|uniref:anoctamin-5 isoform X4 n=1 Tax=Condylostylus longicornis TaxID=2530218 RepID=UPI00244DA3A6|nr:anoctamin-5 isoform X4 [Condylostylus longicornis]
MGNSTSQLKEIFNVIRSDSVVTWRRFQDGERSVDFVLAYRGDDPNPQNHVKRQTFEQNLEKEGLQLEREKTQKIHFVKIHAPLDVLKRYCEILKIKMPIKKLREQDMCNVPEFQLMQEMKSFFGRPFQFVKLDPEKFPPRDYKLHFDYSRNYEYLFDSDNQDFFDSTVRIVVINFILERQRFINDDEFGINTAKTQNLIGIEKLLQDKVYENAFPLHDGDGYTFGSQRYLLLTEWASLKKWIKHQPLDYIKEYFGPKIALYFAWLGFYTHMLIPASVVGIICFLYGLATLSSDKLSNDICNENNTIIMCPQCDVKCDYWLLKETCTSSKFNYLFDNGLTLMFALFMSFWAALYLELWKRYSASLIHRWGLTDFSDQVEHPRPQYLAKIQNSKNAATKFNVVHKVLEPHVPFWKVKFPSFVMSYSVAILFICLSVCAIFSLIVYRMSQRTAHNLYGNRDTMTYKIMVLPLTAGIIDLIVITILDQVYGYLAVFLTDIEYRRTHTEYNESLTIKMYLFQFINYYSSLFYIVFLKGKFVGYPAKYNRIFSFRQEECNPGGCLMELCLQLCIIMMGKQIVNALIEMLLPYLIKTYSKLRIRFGLSTGDSKEKLISCNQWTDDYHLLKWTNTSLFSEYLEMILQYGFITIFVVAFPLAPVFALLNNIVEMRLDALKLLKFYQRPIAQRIKDIGVWYNIMSIVSRIAVGTSAFIIAFSSNFIPKLVYKYTVNSEHNYDGYLNFTLAYFDTRDFQEGTAPMQSHFQNVSECRYPEFRNPYNIANEEEKYKRPLIYWRIFTARLAFIVIFQNIVGMVQSLVAWTIPDVPGKLRNRIKREEYLTRELIIEHEKREAIRKEINKDNNDENNDNGGDSISNQRPLQTSESTFKDNTSKVNEIDEKSINKHQSQLPQPSNNSSTSTTTTLVPTIQTPVDDANVVDSNSSSNLLDTESDMIDTPLYAQPLTHPPEMTESLNYPRRRLQPEYYLDRTTPV